MNESIFGFVIDDSADVLRPFAGLILAAEDVWNITFGFDKQELQERISGYSDCIPAPNLRFYSQTIANSFLPDHSYYDTVDIDGYAALRLAKAYQAYHDAFSMRFAPEAGWPMIESVPKVGVDIIFSNMDPDQLTSDDEIHLYNVLFSVSSEIGSTVYIANSQEQCDDIVDEFLSKEPNLIKFNLPKLVGNALLPPVSDYPPQIITGDIAYSITKVIRYTSHLEQLTKNWDFPWKDKFQ